MAKKFKKGVGWVKGWVNQASIINLSGMILGEPPKKVKCLGKPQKKFLH